MKIQNVIYAYFSPGGTTETTVKSVADVFSDQEGVKLTEINLTVWEERQKLHTFGENDLLILGLPDYGGRIPAVAAEALRRFRGQHTPAVIIATYGNAHLGDPLMEMKKELSLNSIMPIAAAAVVTEHTYLSDLGKGRPDAEDMTKIRSFAEKVKARLEGLSASYNADSLRVPGAYPYQSAPLRGMPFKVETSDACFYCMLCIPTCPVKAIDPGDPKNIDSSVCIRCGACLKVCPAAAKSFTEEPFKELQEGYLRTLVDVRQEPVFIIG